MRFLRYYYYRLYLYYSAQGSIPMASTFIAIILFAFINGFTLLCIYFYTFPEHAFQIPVANSGWKRLAPALFLVPFVFILKHYFKGGLHQSIVKEFESETKRAKRISSIWVVSYVIATFIFFFLSLELIRK
jgi:hypothetical protein